MLYKRDIKITSSLQDAYKLYKKEYKDIDKRLYLDIAYELMITISNMIITESLEYKMPSRLGFLRIRKSTLKLKIKNGKIDINKNIIDWGATWKYWESEYPNLSRKDIIAIKGKKVMFQTNRHTNGEVMRWFWDRITCKVPNKTVYMFKPVKGGIFNNKYTGRLGLAKWIKSDEKTNDYYF